MLIIHHLAVDVVSWSILLEDLGRGYEQLERGEEMRLPAKTSSFKSWSEHLQRYAHSEALQEELSYWRSLELRQTVPLPVDHEGGENSVAAMSAIGVALTAQQTQVLLQEVPKVYHTQINDVLLTALAQVLEKWAGAGRHVIALEGHGREELFEGLDLSRTVGWFTSVFPVVLDIGGASDSGEALQRVKEQLRRIPRRGIGYGILRYLRGVPELSGEPEAQLSFNYIGQLDQDSGQGGLFESALESAGTMRSVRGHRKHLIEVLGNVSQGRLQLSCIYSRAVHERGSIEALAQGFLTSLQELIVHCQSSSGGYTPSDFPLLNITI